MHGLPRASAPPSPNSQGRQHGWGQTGGPAATSRPAWSSSAWAPQMFSDTTVFGGRCKHPKGFGNAETRPQQQEGKVCGGHSQGSLPAPAEPRPSEAAPRQLPGSACSPRSQSSGETWGEGARTQPPLFLCTSLPPMPLPLGPGPPGAKEPTWS